MAQPFKVRIVEAESYCPEARRFLMEVLLNGAFEFRPGQQVRLTIASGGLFEERAYSIASAPNDGRRFDLIIPTGDDKVGRYFAQVPVEQRLSCQGPEGTFGLRDAERDALFVAHGTAVAPMRSICEGALAADGEDGPRRTLLVGARTPNRLVFHERLEALAAEREKFTYLPCVSRPGREDWDGLRGRVLGHLENAVKSFPGEVDVYLCGKPDMIAASRETLAEIGVDPTHILTAE